MAIVSMKDILKKAKEGGYAVGSYNAYDIATIRAVLNAAEKEKSPVILCHAPVHFKFNSLGSVANVMKYEAQKANVPVALLLDHGYEVETCFEAMDEGLNAVMMDASAKSYEENVALVAEVVERAHSMGCHVEGELGHVTRPKSGGAEGDDDDSIIDDKSLYTDPQRAKDYVEKTGVDALAVAFGTAHGVYLKKPELDLERLAEIRATVDVPLVMHGGSGLSEEDIRGAVKAGIQKINYYTGMALCGGMAVKAMAQAKEDRLFYHEVLVESITSMEADVAASMRLFGSAGKA